LRHIFLLFWSVTRYNELNIMWSEKEVCLMNMWHFWHFKLYKIFSGNFVKVCFLAANVWYLLEMFDVLSVNFWMIFCKPFVNWNVGSYNFWKKSSNYFYVMQSSARLTTTILVHQKYWMNRKDPEKYLIPY